MAPFDLFPPKVCCGRPAEALEFTNHILPFVFLQILNKQHQVIASDCIYITDENDLYEDWEFGVKGLSSKDDKQIRRIKDAKNKDYLIDYVSGRIVTDFDGVLDFLRVKDSDGNEFVKIPTLYRKFDGDELVISKYKKDDDYQVYPCFINPQNGKILEEIAIGAYKSGINTAGMIISQPEQVRKTQKLEYWKDHASGPNPYHHYFLRNEDVNQLLRDLFVVVFASRSLSNITKDYVGTHPVNTQTGTTDYITDLIFSYPKNCCGYNFSKMSFKLFGIEDPFNGGSEWIDGLHCVPELTTPETACMYVGDSLEENNCVRFEFNQQNVKQLSAQTIENKLYVFPSELTRKTVGYFDNSVFNMISDSQYSNVLNNVSLFTRDTRFTGLWTYFGASEEEEAYSRLCYYEEDVV